MGVQGLLSTLKPYACCNSNSNISYYSGKNVAIDVSSWLHKSVYSIADLYVETIVEQTQNYNKKNSTMNDNIKKCQQVSADYIYQRCNELKQYGNINIIYLVIDGKRCPLKSNTNQEREVRRQQNLNKARQYRKSQNYNAMYEKYKTCIKITTEFTKDVMRNIQNKQQQQQQKRIQQSQSLIHVVWSPYEADAQLVQLIQDHRADIVITEDSDVLLYSAVCHISFPILYKLDRNTGQCEVWNMDWLLKPNSLTTTPSLLNDSNTNNNVSTTTTKAKFVTNRRRKLNKNSDPNSNNNTSAAAAGNGSTAVKNFLMTINVRQQRYHGLGVRLFIQACILAGCDYAPSTLLNGIGIITAFKLVCNNIHRTSDERLQYIIQQPNIMKKIVSNKENSITDLIILLNQCEAVFYYHPVSDNNNNIIYLTGNPNMNIISSSLSSSNNSRQPPTQEFAVSDGNISSSITNVNDDDVIDYRPSMIKFPQHETWSSFLGHLQNHDSNEESVLYQLKSQHLATINNINNKRQQQTASLFSFNSNAKQSQNATTKENNQGLLKDVSIINHHQPMKQNAKATGTEKSQRLLNPYMKQPVVEKSHHHQHNEQNNHNNDTNSVLQTRNQNVNDNEDDIHPGVLKKRSKILKSNNPFEKFRRNNTTTSRNNDNDDNEATLTRNVSVAHDTYRNYHLEENDVRFVKRKFSGKDCNNNDDIIKKHRNSNNENSAINHDNENIDICGKIDTNDTNQVTMKSFTSYPLHHNSLMEEEDLNIDKENIPPIITIPNHLDSSIQMKIVSRISLV